MEMQDNFVTLTYKALIHSELISKKWNYFFIFLKKSTQILVTVSLNAFFCLIWSLISLLFWLFFIIMRILIWIEVIAVMAALVIWHSTHLWLRYIHILAVGILFLCFMYTCVLVLVETIYGLVVWYLLLHIIEVEDTHRRLAFLEGSAVLNLPLFYLEGICLIFKFLIMVSIFSSGINLFGWLLNFVQRTSLVIVVWSWNKNLEY